MKNHSTLALVLIFLGSVTFLGCERVEKTHSVRTPKGEVVLGGTLRIPINEKPASLEPQALVGADDVEVGIHLYDGLVRLDPQAVEVIPALAESWSLEDKGDAYVFILRHGVLFPENEAFGTGSREVTVKDVVFSLEQLAKHADSTLFRSTVGRLLGATAYRNGRAPSIEGVYVIDDYTLKLKLTKPDRSFPYVLAQPAMGVISKSLSENGEAMERTGVGPFQMVSNDGDILLARNADYHLKDEFGNSYPYIDTLIFVEVGSNTEKLEAFFAGKIDIISNLELDPVLTILEQHVTEFSGKDPKYVMKREKENASYETYTVYRVGLKGLGTGFMGYRDFSRVQIEQ